MVCKISQFMKPELIIADLKAKNKEDVLVEMAKHIAQRVPGIEEQELLQKLTEREQKASTGADQGLAIPHASVQSASELIVALGRSKGGIEFGALDNDVSRFFFTIVSPIKQLKPNDTSYLQAISAICKLMRSSTLRGKLMTATNEAEILFILHQEESLRDSKAVRDPKGV